MKNHAVKIRSTYADYTVCNLYGYKYRCNTFIILLVKINIVITE